MGVSPASQSLLCTGSRAPRSLSATGSRGHTVLLCPGGVVEAQGREGGWGKRRGRREGGKREGRWGKREGRREEGREVIRSREGGERGKGGD